MKIQNIKLRNFRNYEHLIWKFHDGIHLIIGKNAQGKTNLLEAIYYLSTTRSHRNIRDLDAIYKGKDSFLIQADVIIKNKNEELQIIVNQKGKNLMIYKNPINKVSDFIGEINAVMFCPDDMNLFSASPKVRRRFIDLELSKLSKNYVYHLNAYYRIMKERNIYLKNGNNLEYIQTLNEQLIHYEIPIMKNRFMFINELLKKSEQFYEHISKDGTSLKFQYETCIEIEEESFMRKKLLEKYEQSIERDLFLKQTTVGIHKDNFLCEIDDIALSSYASQGQKRSVLLAMKIALIYMIYEQKKEYPILLLDDIFSELDIYRREKLLKYLPKGVQTFITMTDLSDIRFEKNSDIEILEVKNGHLQAYEEVNHEGKVD